MKGWRGGWFGPILVALPFLSPLATAQDKVTFCEAWTIYGRHAPTVAGIARGIFRAEGIEVTHHRGFGSGDTFKRVATATCDYGEAGAGPAALGRVKGIKAKLIAMPMAKFTESTYYFAESGINAPKDIEGKRLTGGPKASSDILMWPIFARANGIDPSKVEVVYMDAGAKPAALGAGKVDVVIDFYSQLPRYEKVAKEIGKKLVTLIWADHGLDLYSNGVIASDETVTKKKDLTLRLLRAYYKGQIWAYQNREAAIDLFLKKYPEQDRAGALQAQDLYFWHFFDGITDKEGFGKINREKMARTIQVTLESSEIKERLAPEELYTNEFVDRLARELLFFKK